MRSRGAEAPLDPAMVLEEAQSRAREILADAQVEMTSLRESAVAEARKSRGEARDAGYAEGFREGRDAGLERASDLVRQAEDALDAAKEAFTQMALDAEPKILALALDTAKRITSEALVVEPEIALELIRKGMNALKDEREFSLRVDPALVSLVEGAADDLGKEYGARSLEVIPDGSVKGGAIVRTPHGFVDVTLETQIRNISLALAEARRRTREDVQ